MEGLYPAMDLESAEDANDIMTCGLAERVFSVTFG